MMELDGCTRGDAISASRNTVRNLSGIVDQDLVLRWFFPFEVPFRSSDTIFSVPTQYRYFRLYYELIPTSVIYQDAMDDTHFYYLFCSVECCIS